MRKWIQKVDSDCGTMMMLPESSELEVLVRDLGVYGTLGGEGVNIEMRMQDSARLTM